MAAAITTTFPNGQVYTTAVELPYPSLQTSYYNPYTRTAENQETIPSSRTSTPVGGTYTVLAAATSTITESGNPFPGGEQNAWEIMAAGSKAAVVIAIVIGIVAIVIFSIWFCCGGRAKWAQHHRPAEQSHALARDGEIALHPVDRSQQRGGGRRGPDAPPRYEEAVPPGQQRLAGGLPVRGGLAPRCEDEESTGVISDGKTPLSEIPFEDVVVSRTVSESESSSSARSPAREFTANHHLQGGDTRGHTNT